MGREWKPGDVGITDAKYGHEVAARFLVADAGPLLAFMYEDGQRLTVPPRDGARALVALDPENREQVERFTVLLYAALGDDFNGSNLPDGYSADGVRTALRQMLAPPKPNEPAGLGAVVEDADGSVMVRTNSKPEHPWTCAGTGTIWNWSSVDAVRVLSEGVAPC